MQVETICLPSAIIPNGVFKILSDNREIVKNNFCEIIISTDLIVSHRSSVDESSDGLLEFPFWFPSLLYLFPTVPFKFWYFFTCKFFPPKDNLQKNKVRDVFLFLPFYADLYICNEKHLGHHHRFYFCLFLKICMKNTIWTIDWSRSMRSGPAPWFCCTKLDVCPR